MRKIFTLFAAVVCSMTMFAQSLQLETKSGQVIANGSTVTVEGEMVDLTIQGMLEANLFVRNLTEKDTTVIVRMTAIKEVSQICFGGLCSTVPVGQSLEKAGVVTAGATANLQIEMMKSSWGDGYTPGSVYACTVEVIMWLKGNPDDKVSATVTFTNDPEVLAAGVESAEVNSAKVYANGNVLYYNFANAADRQLQVFDVTGHLQKDIRLTSEAGNLSLEGMTKGLYIYRVAEAGKNVVSGKFLVK